MSFAAVVLVLGILCLLFMSRAFRRVAGVFLVIAAVGVLILVAWWQANQAQQKRKQELAKTYVKTNQVELIDPRVSFSSYNGRPDRITGRIRNNSTYGIQSVEVRLVFEDCLPSNKCEMVGDEKEEIYISIPPNQSRDFEEYISGPTISPKGKIAWSYQVTSVSARVE